MKKSIAFLGALLFGSVTFGQVTKNDSINKSSSRKVSSEDMKNFPEDMETTTNTGGIKGETLEKHKGDLLEKHKGEQRDFQKMTIKHATMEKHASDASAGTSSKTTAEKQPKLEKYTIKLSNSSKKVEANPTEEKTLPVHEFIKRTK